MELNDRFSVLFQGAQIAQKNGVLTLDDAAIVKRAIDMVKSNDDNIKDAVSVLVKIVTQAQSKGAYSLKDAHLLYIAIDGIEEVMDAAANVEN